MWQTVSGLSTPSKSSSDGEPAGALGFNRERLGRLAGAVLFRSLFERGHPMRRLAPVGIRVTLQAEDRSNTEQNGTDHAENKRHCTRLAVYLRRPDDTLGTRCNGTVSCDE